MLGLSQPQLGPAEIKAVTKVLKTGQLAQGPVVAELEAEIAARTNSKYAVAFNSGTAALHAALYGLNISEGDEVIAPPFTFIATVSPVVMQRAKVVFADVSLDDYMLDPLAVADRLTKRTKAVIPVDLYGQTHNYKDLKKVLSGQEIAVIEDACQAIGAEVSSKPAGTLGEVGVFSLYATKNIMCGEGGLLVTSKKTLYERAKLLRHHGQSEKTRYTYHDIGYNYRLTDIQAAIALVQLQKLERLNKKRQQLAQRLTKGLAEIPGLITPVVKKNHSHVFHQYTVRITPEFRSSRQKLITHLQEKNIASGVYYPIPLHLQPAFTHLGHKPGEFPVAEQLANEVLSLPVHPGLTLSDIEYITTTIRSYAKA